MNDEMTKLKEHLSGLLLILKRNRDNVELELLKTKYEKSYFSLCREIRIVAEEYVKSISLKDIKIDKNDLDDTVVIIKTAIENSGLLKEISKALYVRQNISEVEMFAMQLRKIILEILCPYFVKHTDLLITDEIFN